jgi:hypothetical protein
MRKSFVMAFVLFTIILLLLTAGCVQEEVVPIACTEEAKICPDGTTVGRLPPNCEFAPCPSGTTTTPPPEHFPETPEDPFKKICEEGEVKTATCPDGSTTYEAENCVDGKWISIAYIRNPCEPIPAGGHMEDG